MQLYITLAFACMQVKPQVCKLSVCSAYMQVQ